MSDRVKVFVGNLEVLASGTVTSLGLEPTLFHLSGIEGMTMRVSVVFDQTEPAVRWNAPNTRDLIVVFHNPAGVGWGLLEPVEIGVFDKRALLFQFRVSMLGDRAAYALDYNLLLGGARNG